MKTQLIRSLCLLLLTALPSLADDCDYTAERDATIDAAGASMIEIDVAAGSLEVVGVAGLTEVRASGEACASRESLLDEIEIRTVRKGTRVVIVAEMPESRFSFRSATARLDLKIEVPADVSLEIDDSSGSIEILDTAGVEIDDSSGEIRAENVGGDLEIDDSSGAIYVTEVAGNVLIDDSSGEIDVRRVHGSVEIESDSSGAIDISDVDLDVLIREDSSGSIQVSRIGGDFTVRDDSSGGIDYRDVSGRVDIPKDH